MFLVKNQLSKVKLVSPFRKNDLKKLVHVSLFRNKDSKKMFLVYETTDVKWCF